MKKFIVLFLIFISLVPVFAYTARNNEIEMGISYAISKAKDPNTDRILAPDGYSVNGVGLSLYYSRTVHTKRGFDLDIWSQFSFVLPQRIKLGNTLITKDIAKRFSFLDFAVGACFDFTWGVFHLVAGAGYSVTNVEVKYKTGEYSSISYNAISSGPALLLKAEYELADKAFLSFTVLPQLIIRTHRDIHEYDWGYHRIATATDKGYTLGYTCSATLALNYHF